MPGFNLSPGITPFITDVAVLGFTLSFGIAVLFTSHKGVKNRLTYYVLGANALVLSAFKIYTDYTDFWDVALSALIMLEAMVIISYGIWDSKGTDETRSGIGYFLLAIAGAAFSIYKITADFYDPYDLLQACLGILCSVPIFIVAFPSGKIAEKKIAS